jgi:hypothetical protein
LASLDYRNQASGRDTVKAVAILVVLLAVYVLVCTIDADSRDANTGCLRGEHLTAQGDCR